MFKCDNKYLTLDKQVTHCMPTSELRNKARPEFCGSLGTGYRSTGTGRLSGNNARQC